MSKSEDFIKNAATFGGAAAWGDGGFLKMLESLMPLLVGMIPMCFPMKEMKLAAVASVKDLTRSQERSRDNTALREARRLVNENEPELRGLAKIRRVRSLAIAAVSGLERQVAASTDYVLGEVFDEIVTI